MPEALPEPSSTVVHKPYSEISVIQKPRAQSIVKAKVLCAKKSNAPICIKKKKRPKEAILNPTELDFEVENHTGKTVYVTCFVYQRKRDFGHWRWDKSPVYKLEDNQTAIIDLDTIPDEQDRNNVFGYLGVFNDEKTAQDATYELTDDHYLLDLDLVSQLQGKKVTLEIEKYGKKGEFFEYDFVQIKGTENHVPPELDFSVENKTGKPILVTCFVYEKKAKGRWIAATETKDDMSVWRFDKTPIIRLEPDQIGIIDVDTITGDRDRNYMRGYLAVFDVDEQDEIEKATYELLDSKHKLHLGELSYLKNKKVVIDIEKYGIMEDFIDFTIKPVKKIDFTTIR